MKITAKVFLLGLLLSLHNCSSVPSPLVDPRLVERFSKDKTATVIVHMRDTKLDEVRANFRQLTFNSRADKLNTFYEMMTSNADARQERVLSHLEKLQTKHNFRHTQLWIINGLILRDVNKEVIYELARNFPEIERIDLERVFPLWDSKISNEIHILEKTRSKVTPEASLSYAYDKMNSLEANNIGCNGDGVTVAIIDTGVDYRHISLRENYRGWNPNDQLFHHDYNWFCPPDHSKVKPYDEHGHGTHCMSTAVGLYTFSAAPKAKWMACKGTIGSDFADASLLECGQWVTCPTDSTNKNPNCSKAPHIVSNSWGGGHGDSWYDQVIHNWEACQIFSIFSNGNDGPNCGSANSPGDSPSAFAVGACDEHDKIASFSSCGPTLDGRVKPDCTCYGVNIAGAATNTTSGYTYMNGTSMATPLVAGCAAAALSCNKFLTCEDLREILRQTSKSCPAEIYCDASKDIYCNNRFGHGIVDTFAASKMALDMRLASKALRNGVKQ